MVLFFLANHRATDFPYAKTCGICDLDWVAPFQGFLAIGRQVCVAKCVCFVSSNIFLSLYIIIYAKLLISFYLLQQISDYSLIPPTLDAILTPSYNTQIGCRRSLVLLRLLHNLYFCLQIRLSLLIFRTLFLKKADIIHTSCILKTNKYRFHSRKYQLCKSRNRTRLLLHPICVLYYGVKGRKFRKFLYRENP